MNFRGTAENFEKINISARVISHKQNYMVYTDSYKEYYQVISVVL